MMRAAHTEPDPELLDALTAARVAVNDLMLFVGVDPDEARAATREERPRGPQLEVRVPAAGQKGWIRALRRRLRLHAD
jgi:hypothetical protein